MAFALRRRILSCFYCGQKTSHKAEGKSQQFRCSSCEAVNYLDKNGQITDPPSSIVSSTTSSFRFAHAPGRPASPSPPPDADSIFCTTCLKNQHLVKENLAAYLPPEDDPQYETYAKSYDEYKEKLESRYPQVCSDCVPKVRQQIMKTSYTAKADHLRRMMDRTRHGYGAGAKSGIAYNVLLRVAGIGWVLGTVVQMCWHAMVALSIPRQWSLDEYQETLFSGPAPTPEECVYQAINSRSLNRACVAPVTSWMPYVIALSVATIWWNRHLQTVYTRPAISLVGVRDYYVLQVSTLVIKIGGLYLLRPDASHLSGDMLKASHLFMIMLLALTSIISLNTIKLDMAPKVSFTIDEATLLPDVVKKPSDNTGISPKHPLYKADIQSPFPINKLAVGSNSIYTQARQTPHKVSTALQENEFSDSEAMDWTPSSAPPPSFNPTISHSRPVPFSMPAGPSPFHGALPAAPQAPAHRLRKPAALQPGALRKVSETQKETFSANFSSFGLRSSTPASRQQNKHSGFTTDEDTATEDEGGRTRTVGKKRREMEIANPKFWPQADLQKTTGLETLFEETLDMADTPTGLNGSIHQRKNGVGLEGRSNPVWGSFEETTMDQGMPKANWLNPFTIGLVPIASLGAAVLIVKGGIM